MAVLKKRVSLDIEGEIVGLAEDNVTATRRWFSSQIAEGIDRLRSDKSNALHVLADVSENVDCLSQFSSDECFYVLQYSETFDSDYGDMTQTLISLAEALVERCDVVRVTCCLTYSGSGSDSGSSYWGIVRKRIKKS